MLTKTAELNYRRLAIFHKMKLNRKSEFSVSGIEFLSLSRSSQVSSSSVLFTLYLTRNTQINDIKKSEIFVD